MASIAMYEESPEKIERLARSYDLFTGRPATAVFDLVSGDDDGIPAVRLVWAHGGNVIDMEYAPDDSEHGFRYAESVLADRNRDVARFMQRHVARWPSSSANAIEDAWNRRSVHDATPPRVKAPSEPRHGVRSPTRKARRRATVAARSRRTPEMAGPSYSPQGATTKGNAFLGNRLLAIHPTTEGIQRVAHALLAGEHVSYDDLLDVKDGIMAAIKRTYRWSPDGTSHAAHRETFKTLGLIEQSLERSWSLSRMPAAHRANPCGCGARANPRKSKRRTTRR